MKPVFAVLFLAGLTLAISLIAWQGFGTVMGVLGTGGWWLCWLAPCSMAYLLLDTAAWQVLCLPGKQGFSRLYFANWVGNAVNWLLPVGQVGGDAVRAHYVIRCGAQESEAGGAGINDIHGYWG